MGGVSLHWCVVDWLASHPFFALRSFQNVSGKDSNKALSVLHPCLLKRARPPPSPHDDVPLTSRQVSESFTSLAYLRSRPCDLPRAIRGVVPHPH
jgi:hypothetical protein